MVSQRPESRGGAGRNDACPCGSGRKSKHCCAGKAAAGSFEDQLAEAEFRRGLGLEREGRADEAVTAYRLAASLRPLPRAHSRAGHVLLTLGRGQAAAAEFRAAAAADPRSSERRMDLVRALTLEKRDAEAEAEVRGALAADPGSADGYWLLGRILADGGRFGEARAALERSIALNPRQGVVYYDLVRSFTLTEADRPLIRRMLAVARAPADTDQRVRLQFALGKAFDDLGDPGAAMQHFARANGLKTAMVAFDRAGFAARVDTLIARFTPAFFAAHAAGGSLSETPVMVLGLPRSGTTLVEQILSSHAEVEGAGELQFWPAHSAGFDRPTDDAAIGDLQQMLAREALATLEAIAPGASRVTDKNPFNFLWIGLIHLVFPRAVILHCRRSPIDTCLSIFSTYFAPRPDFPADRDDLVFYYRQYQRLMDHWRAVLPPERFVELDYEALVADPEPQSRRLVAACGLTWDPACLRPQDNRRIVRTASRWQARQPISAASVARWRRYEPWLGSLAILNSGRRV